MSLKNSGPRKFLQKCAQSCHKKSLAQHLRKLHTAPILCNSQKSSASNGRKCCGGAIVNTPKDQQTMKSSALLTIAAGHAQTPGPKRFLGLTERGWWQAFQVIKAVMEHALKHHFLARARKLRALLTLVSNQRKVKKINSVAAVVTKCI